jgi:hypothetical protein
MTAVSHTLDLISTSRADDASYGALLDMATALRDHDDSRVVGGHMVELLQMIHPTPGLPHRRTNDSDAAITTAIAGSGDVHSALTAVGYEPTSGNHYRRGDREIDLLIPSASETFRSEEHGGRAFDAAPGLRLALSAEPTVVEATVEFLDGELRTGLIRVPRVEIALVIKALATRSRSAPKDLADISTLLALRAAHTSEDLLGWMIDSGPLTGARREAAAVLHRIADLAERGLLPASAEVVQIRLAAAVRAYVARPDRSPDATGTPAAGEGAARQ